MIICFGFSREEKREIDLIEDALKGSFGFRRIGGNSHRLILENYARQFPKERLAVFSPKLWLGEEPSLDKELMVLSSSQNISTLSLAYNNSLKTVCYGLSQADSLSPSSSKEELCLSLNRSVRNVYGELILPMDLPFPLESLSANGALMLFGSIILGVPKNYLPQKILAYL